MKTGASPERCLLAPLLLAALPVACWLAQAGAQPPKAASPAAVEATVVPADTAIGRSRGTLQHLLLAPLDASAPVEKGGWRMQDLSSAPAPVAVAPRVGQAALLLRGDAEAGGAKGDFGIAGAVPGQAKLLGAWVHLAAGANVGRVGFQVHDAEGEVLIATVPADWQGWRWMELDLGAPALAPAYNQPGKNRKPDMPLAGVHLAWFAQAAGTSSLAVNALVAATELKDAPGQVELRLTGAAWGETNAPLATQELVTTNFTPAARAVEVEYVVQRDPVLYSTPAPDPAHGTDHALGARSWTEAAGKTLESDSLTDGREWTNAALPWGKHREAAQYVDLGRERTITHLALQPADAGWAWTLEVSASADGKSYRPVPGLEALDLHNNWGRQLLPVARPFAARYLRLRHHRDGQEVNQISMPSALSVYDGPADEKWELPSVGTVVARGRLSQTVPPRSFSTLRIRGDRPLPPGAYLVAARVKEGSRTHLFYRHYMVMPSPLAPTAESRFGLNTSDIELAKLHRRLGIGWVRFENLKWQMVSPAQNRFTFHGLLPWNVKHDEIMSRYRAQGLSILPFLFQTADYATTAPASVHKNRNSYPPRDNAELADFVFQTVARYGSRKHPDSVLKTEDKRSGLNQINVYEIWNEPNLTDPGWGPWVGTTTQYNTMFRAAAEAVKRADPTARVTNGGFAGIDVETVNTLLLPYADGKKPLDFVDILNVHFYSGRSAPELSTNDPNADRSGSTQGVRTYEDDLRRLLTWRNRHKPGMPIWMTETGYDSAGPFGTDERTQAARLPRVVMMALAAGIDRVLVYREAGSTPSMHAASGMVRNDGTLKPAWFTYATLIRELDGVKTGALRLPYPDENVRLYAWGRGGETVLTAWTTEGEGELKLRLGESTVTDAFGHTRRVNVAERLPLSEFPTYIKSIGSPEQVRALMAQARRLEAAREQQRQRLAKLRAYLFDFGSRERVGTIEIGDTRTFTAVLGSDVYDEKKGYGFYPGAGGADSDAHYISDALERDGTRMNPDHAFRLHARPGRYELRVRLGPRGTGQLVVKGAVGGDRTVPLRPDGPLVVAEVEIGENPVVLSNTAYSDIRWLTLIERPADRTPLPR